MRASASPPSGRRASTSSRSRVESGGLDRDRGKPLPRLRRGTPELGLPRAERPELLPELAGAAAARVDARPERRLEAKGALRGRVEERGDRVRPLGQLEQEAGVGPRFGPGLRLRAGGEPELVARQHGNGVEAGGLRELEALARLGGVPELGAVPAGSRRQCLLEGRSGRRSDRPRGVGAERCARTPRRARA